MLADHWTSHCVVRADARHDRLRVHHQQGLRHRVPFGANARLRVQLMSDETDRDIRDRLIRLEERIEQLRHSQSRSERDAQAGIIKVEAEVKAVKEQLQTLLNLFEQAKGVKWMMTDSKIMSFLWGILAAGGGYLLAKFGFKI